MKQLIGMLGLVFLLTGCAAFSGPEDPNDIFFEVDDKPQNDKLNEGESKIQYPELIPEKNDSEKYIEGELLQWSRGENYDKDYFEIVQQYFAASGRQCVLLNIKEPLQNQRIACFVNDSWQLMKSI